MVSILALALALTLTLTLTLGHSAYQTTTRGSAFAILHCILWSQFRSTTVT